MGWAVAGGIVDGTVPLLHLGLARGYAPADIPDLHGRVAVVTGAATGSGGGEAVVSWSAEQNEQALHLQYWQSASRVR